jgi:LacI family transcriptional regulator
MRAVAIDRSTIGRGIPSLSASPMACWIALPPRPVVLVDRFLELDVDQVGTENEAPATQLVSHLLQAGHRRIALVAGLGGLSTTEERIRGYRTALERASIPRDDALIARGGSLHEPARAEVHRLLDLARPPTAIVAANNAMTIGVLHALRERRLAVPDDIALAAFDDFEWSDLFQPRLTVIAQPTAAIGSTAVDLLLARLDDPARETRAIRLAPKFVHRESCGCRP